MKKYCTGLIILFIFSILFPIAAESQLKNEILKELVSGMGKTNFGTEFWFTVPPALTDNMPSSSNSVRIYVFPLYKTDITLNVLSKGIHETKKANGGETVEFSLLPSAAQPYLKSGVEPVVASDIYLKAGIRISSNAPVSVYVLVLYNQTTEGFLAYPVNLLGNEYIVSSYADASIYYPIYNSLPRLTGIVAVYDGTEITFIMGGNSKSASSDGLKPGESITRLMNRGDVWMFSTKGRGSDLSGSKITSTLPVAVVSANQSANIPLDNKWNDYIVEMETPTKTWGKDYLLGNIYGRKFSPIIRVYGKNDNTDIYLNNNKIGNIQKSGGIQNEGFLEIRPDDYTTSKFFSISSDNPINVVYYNTGSEEDGLPTPPGDPFLMTLSPVEQFQKSIMFSFPPISFNQNESNYVNIYFELDDQDNIPDSFELIHFTVDSISIRKVKNLKLLYNEKVKGSNGKYYGFVCLKLFNYGEYTLRSEYGFAAYLYGFNNSVTYGFPASIQLKDLTSKDSIAPSVVWSEACGGVIQGFTKDMPDDHEIRSGLAGILNESDEFINFDSLKHGKITPIRGATISVDWSLAVVDLNLPAKAVIHFWDVDQNVATTNIYYQPKEIKFDRNFENYGTFKLNDKETKEFTISNKSQNQFIIKNLNLKFANTGFSIINQNISFPITLDTNSVFKFDVLFTAIKEGTIVDSLGFEDSCGVMYKVHLEASVGSPVINVDDIYYGDVVIGRTDTKTFIITNAGVSDLTISDYKLPLSDEFNVDFGTVISSDKPLKLVPGQKHVVTVDFTPKTESTIIDSVVFYSDAQVKDATALFTARGVPPGLIASSFDWQRRRIDRKNFPSGPYQVEDSNKAITISNTGSRDITIKEVKTINELNSDAFKLNTTILNNHLIKPDSIFYLKVEFKPTKLGDHELDFQYYDEKGSLTQTNLQGFGTVPQIKSEIFKFDTAMIKSYENPKIVFISITNLSVQDWEFADTVTIFDISPIYPDEISTKWDEYGTKGFKFDGNEIELPLRIAPGKSLVIPVAFAPETEDYFESDLRIISDSYQDPIIKLKGYGINQDITVIGGIGTACINQYDTITSTIKNNGSRTLSFAPLKFKEPVSEFSFFDQNDLKSFDLEPSESRNIKILFKPVNSLPKEAELVFELKNTPEIQKIAQLKGEPRIYKLELVMSPLDQTSEISEMANIKLSILNTDDISNISLNEMNVVIKFNSDFLKPEPIDSILYGKLIAGKFLIRNMNSPYPDEIHLNIKSIAGNVFNGSGDLFSMNFETFFPTDSINYSDINISIEPLNNTCAKFESVTGRINTKLQCLNDLRKIKFSALKYSLEDVYPNPVNSMEVNINFTIAIDAITDFYLQNSLGEIISKPLNTRLTQGTYNLKIPLKDISSGLYFYTVKSGPFIQTKKMIINK
jgi:hypothetical protein